MVKLVTVATHSDGYLPWLEKSCEKYNTKLIKLGWNQKWQGYNWKLDLMIDYLKTIDPNELICFIDAYDVLLLRPFDEIEQYYNDIVKLTNKKIIIANDIVHDKSIKFISKLIFKTCKDLSINSGTYMGKAGDLFKHLNLMIENTQLNDNDQIVYTKYCKKNPDIFYIDHDKIFFLTIQVSLKDILNYGIVINDKKELFYEGTQPFFIHGNGNSNMDNLIKALDYKITDEDINSLNMDHYNFLKSKFKHYSSCFYNENIGHDNLIMILIILLLIYIYLKYPRK